MSEKSLRERSEELLASCRCAIGEGYSVTVTGHDMPDADSMISAVMMRSMLSRFGVESTVKFATMPDRVTLRDMEKLGIADEVTYGDFGEREKLLLVDHHKTFYNTPVLGCVDHHTSPPKPDFDGATVISASSCGRVIFDMLCSLGAATDEDERLAVYSVYLDTQSCRTPKFKQEDTAWLDGAIARLMIDREELVRMGFCLNSADEDISELAMYGYKKYCFDGIESFSTCIQIDPADHAWESKVKGIVDYLVSETARRGGAVWAFAVNKPAIERSDIYFIYPDGRVGLVLPSRLASRSRDVIPVVQRISANRANNL